MKPWKSLPLLVEILGEENTVHLWNTTTESPQNNFICRVKPNATGNIHKTVPCPISAAWHSSHSSQWRQMEALHWALYLCSLSMNVFVSTVRRAQSHLKWYSLYFYVPSFTLFETSTSSVKDCQSRDKAPWSLCLSTEAQAADPPAGIGITSMLI